MRRIPRLGRFSHLGGSVTGGVVLPFDQQVLALPGLLAWWPQTEASGLVADNAEGTAARDAAYYTDANVTQQGAAFPFGDNVALYAPLGRLRFGTANLGAAWNWDDFWTVIWALPDATEQADSSNHYWQYSTGVAGTTRLTVLKGTAGPYYTSIDHRPNASAVVPRLSWLDWVYSPKYTQIAIMVRGGTAYAWRNGVLVKTVASIPASTTATLDLTSEDYNILAAGNAASGAFPHFAVGSGALTTDHVNDLYESIYPGVKNLFVCGDSFATDNDYWVAKTYSNLEYSSGEVWRERPYRVGLSGQKVAALHTELDANISSYVGTPDVVLVHIGTNDVTGTPTSEASFKADLRGVIDALHGQWSGASIYCALPWRADADYTTELTALAGWITSVCGEYAYANVGIDYTASWWVDNVATLTLDNVHPNDAGHIAIAGQWQTVLGY